MSAKINVETDDPKLAAILTVVIANAVRLAGFGNVMAKTVMVENVINSTQSKEVDKVSYSPPELKTLDWVVPDNAFEFIDEVVQNNIDLVSKPIVISGIPDTSEKYEECVSHFLKSEST